MMEKKEKVILRRIPTYDPRLIGNVIKEGLESFGKLDKVHGRVTVKPNTVMAHHRVTPSAYTRPEFLEGALNALGSPHKEGTRVTLAEKSGAGIPTYRMFQRAGYSRLKKTHRLKIAPIDEAKKVTVPLQKGKIRSSVTTSREIANNDFLLYLPKLKTNALTQGMTAAIKLNVGIMRDRERMRDHNYRLDEKIVDLLEVGYPDFIATDAIEISLGGNHLTQRGYDLGIVVMAINPVAHDTVCAHILNLDPKNINHLRLAGERGYGPTNLEEIDIEGDVSLEEIQQKTRQWDLGVFRIEEFDSPFQAYCGEPYCPGGCHGILMDWLYMIKDRKPRLWKRLPAWSAVMGKYKGDITADRLMLIGSCTEIQGKTKARVKRKVKGCPPKHKDLVLWFFLKAGIMNPLFRLDLIWDAYPCLFFSWIRRFFKGGL